MERKPVSSLLPSAESLRDRMAAHQNEAYRIGSEYNSKGRLGKFIMRLTYRGDKKPKLQSGLVTYSRHHYPEEVIRAHNDEVMKSWAD
jgi:hypothetical protein